jgi:hypothetical protein
MIARLRFAGFIAVAATILSWAPGAWADKIDGDWCFDDGRHFSIDGPRIVTPLGSHIAGNYARHAFSYVVPAPEPAAGKTVRMLLLNENTVDLSLGGGATETWHRCSPNISRLEGPKQAAPAAC